MNKILLLSGITILVLLSLISVRNSNIVTQANAQACAAPAAVSGVTVEYPGTPVGSSQMDLTQADCKWNSQSDAASYNVTVTEIETGTVIKNNESVASSITKVIFPITQKKTYKCSVVAVSACGSQGAAGVDQLLCEADAMISPTAVPPTATPIPPTPTKVPPKPTLVPGGTIETIAISGGVLLALVGGIFLLLL